MPRRISGKEMRGRLGLSIVVMWRIVLGNSSTAFNAMWVIGSHVK